MYLLPEKLVHHGLEGQLLPVRYERKKLYPEYFWQIAGGNLINWIYQLLPNLQAKLLQGQRLVQFGRLHRHLPRAV